MGKLATQEDFNLFLEKQKENVPLVLRAMFSKEEANRLRGNWRKYAIKNGLNPDIGHLKNPAEEKLKENEDKLFKRKSKY